MPVWTALAHVMVLLGSAAALGFAFQRLRQSAVVGYLAAGIILGPGVAGAVERDPLVEGVAEAGVVLLLFVVGLEFPWKRLRKMGAVALGGTALQLLGTTALGTGALLAAGFPAKEAAILGGVLAPSATALLLRTLSERASADAVYARNAAVITVVQGAYDIPLLIMLSTLAAGGTGWAFALGVGKAAGFVVVLIATLYVFAVILLPRALRAVAAARSRELSTTVAVLTCMFSAWAAGVLGVPPALGAFVAGTLIAGSPFAVQVRTEVGPLKTVFSTVFFASFGILLDVTWIAANGATTALVVLGIVVGKTLVVWPVMRLFRSSHAHAVATGVCLATVDEFAFVLAQVGRSVGVLSEGAFQLISSAALGALFLTPFLVRLAPGTGRLVERALTRLRLTRRPSGDVAARPDLRNHVIVVGYGPAGRGVAAALMEAGVTVVVAELNPETVTSTRRAGVRAEVGDASREEVLEHLSVERASAVVVTLPDAAAAIEIVSRVRQTAPQVPVIARARNHVHAPDFEAAGARVVVDEEMEMGRALGVEAVSCLLQGIPVAAGLGGAVAGGGDDAEDGGAREAGARIS